MAKKEKDIVTSKWRSFVSIVKALEPLAKGIVKTDLNELFLNMKDDTYKESFAVIHDNEMAPLYQWLCTDLDTMLGPEMKSTGEVLGIAPTMTEALYKGLLGAGYRFTKKGGIFITVRDSDKNEAGPLAEKFARLGFKLYATEGTAKVLREYGLSVTLVHKIHESKQNTLVLLESGKVNYIISTSAKGRLPARDSVKVRRKSVELGIPCLTSLDTASSLADILGQDYSKAKVSLIDICKL